MRKRLITLLTAAALSAAMSVTAFANGWVHNEHGWWYATDEIGSQWHANGWQWIDGNKDGVAECYYFDSNGYMAENTTTPDGYQVNADGAWVENGVVQTKTVDVAAPATQQRTETGSGNLEAQSGYNNRGVSLTALDMLKSSREENAAKYTETKADDFGSMINVYYANGFRVLYPQGDSGQSKSVSASNKDYKMLFEYYDESIGSAEDAADYLHTKGFYDGFGGAYANGNTCFIQAEDDDGDTSTPYTGLQWSNFNVSYTKSTVSLY